MTHLRRDKLEVELLTKILQVMGDARFSSSQLTHCPQDSLDLSRQLGREDIL